MVARTLSGTALTPFAICRRQLPRGLVVVSEAGRAMIRMFKDEPVLVD